MRPRALLFKTRTDDRQAVELTEADLPCWGFPTLAFISSTKAHMVSARSFVAALRNSLKVTVFGCSPASRIDAKAARARDKSLLLKWALVVGAHGGDALDRLALVPKETRSAAMFAPEH